MNTAMKNTTKRIEFIDIMKGLGIILVILSHTRALEYHDIGMYVSAFFMPMFFMVSGIFFRYEDRSIRDIVMKRCKQLLMPFLIWTCLIYLPLYLIMYHLGMNIDHTPKQVIEGAFFITYNGYYPIGTGMWFLVCFFITSVMCAVLYKVMPQYIALSIVVVLAVLKIYVIEWLPFEVDLALLANLYYVCGYYIKDRIKDIAKIKNWTGFILLIVVYIVLVRYNGFCDYAGREYGRYSVLFILNSYIGIIILAKSSWIISKMQIINKLLINIGQNTIPLLICNGLVISVLSRIIPQNNIVWLIIEAIVTIGIIMCGSYIVRKVDKTNKVHLLLFGQ